MSKVASLVLLMVFLGLAGCKPNKTVELETVPVPDETLTFHTPLEVALTVDKKGKYNVELSIKYREDAMYLDRQYETEIAPIFMRLSGPTAKQVRDAEYTFQLKDGLGWRGAPAAEGRLRTIRKDMYNSIPLEPGQYTLAIWSNARTDQDEYTLNGIVEIGCGLRKMN